MGAGMMVAVLKQVGTLSCDSGMSVITSASGFAHAFRHRQVYFLDQQPYLYSYWGYRLCWLLVEKIKQGVKCIKLVQPHGFTADGSTPASAAVDILDGLQRICDFVGQSLLISLLRFLDVSYQVMRKFIHSNKQHEITFTRQDSVECRIYFSFGFRFCFFHNSWFWAVSHALQFMFTVCFFSSFVWFLHWLCLSGYLIK